MQTIDPSIGRVLGATVRALVIGKGSASAATSYLMANAPSGATIRAAEILKGAIGATDPELLGSALLPAGTDLGNAIRSGRSLFAELLRAGARRVLARVKYVESDGTTRATFVAPALPAPVSKGHYEGDPLVPVRLVALIARSREIIRSDPNADATLSQDLAAAVALGADEGLLAYSTPASNAHPGGLGTVGAVIPAGAQTVAAVDAGIRAILQHVFNGGGTQASTLLALHPTLLATMATQRNGDVLAWPSLSQTRPALAGCLVIPTAGAPWGGSPGSGTITAIDALQTRFTDSDELGIDVSETAALEMSDSPTQDGTAGTGSTVVSMWQSDSAAIRATRHVAWRAHSQSVATLTDVGLA